LQPFSQIKSCLCVCFRRRRCPTWVWAGGRNWPSAAAAKYLHWVMRTMRARRVTSHCSTRAAGARGGGGGCFLILIGRPALDSPTRPRRSPASLRLGRAAVCLTLRSGSPKSTTYLSQVHATMGRPLRKSRGVPSPYAPVRAALRVANDFATV
jgi:hypothetical protein